MNTEFNIFGKKIKMEQIVELVKVMAKIGILFIILVSMLLINRSVLLSPDDYNYTFVQGCNYTKRVDSLSNALETGKFFYNNWTGRVLPHVLIGVFRNLPSIVYEVINTAVFLIFILVITKVLNKKSSYLSILAVFGYLGFSMMFGEKFAWISGAFNYLWPSACLAIFVYYFYNYFIGEKQLNALQKIALAFWAFITGFTHENVAFVGGAFLGCLFLFKIKEFLKFNNKKKIVTVLIFIMFCLGAFATIFAPGNFKRMDFENRAFSWSFLGNYKDNKLVLITVVISMIVAFIVENFELLKTEKFKSIKKLDYDTIKLEVLHFVLPAIIATVPMAVISYFPPRAFLAYEVMFMIVLSRNVTIIAEHLKEHNVVIAIISVVCGLIVFGHFSPSTLGQINYIIPYKEKVTSQYEEAFNKGEKDVLVSKFEYLNWIHADDYINISNFFPELNYHMPVNALICLYYGFDRVTAVGDNEYLIELEVDTEGIHKYILYEKETGTPIQFMEYDELIRYCIPKDKLGSYVLYSEEGDLESKILSANVRYIGGELSNVNVDDLITEINPGL